MSEGMRIPQTMEEEKATATNVVCYVASCCVCCAVMVWVAFFVCIIILLVVNDTPDIRVHCHGLEDFVVVSLVTPFLFPVVS
jgi:hypothetical protein